MCAGTGEPWQGSQTRASARTCSCSDGSYASFLSCHLAASLSSHHVLCFHCFFASKWLLFQAWKNSDLAVHFTLKYLVTLFCLPNAQLEDSPSRRMLQEITLTTILAPFISMTTLLTPHLLVLNPRPGTHHGHMCAWRLLILLIADIFSFIRRNKICQGVRPIMVW